MGRGRRMCCCLGQRPRALAEKWQVTQTNECSGYPRCWHFAYVLSQFFLAPLLAVASARF